jgi:hypothetical protein
LAKEEYERHFEEIIEREVNSIQGVGKVKLFRRANDFMQCIPKVRGLWNRTVMQALYRLPGPDLPPIIRFHSGSWTL